MILILKGAQAFGLIDLQAVVLLAPPVEGLAGDAVRRMRSPVFAPARFSCRMATICSSVKRLFRIGHTELLIRYPDAEHAHRSVATRCLHQADEEVLELLVTACGVIAAREKPEGAMSFPEGALSSRRAVMLSPGNKRKKPPSAAYGNRRCRVTASNSMSQRRTGSAETYSHARRPRLVRGLRFCLHGSAIRLVTWPK